MGTRALGVHRAEGHCDLKLGDDLLQEVAPKQESGG